MTRTIPLMQLLLVSFALARGFPVLPRSTSSPPPSTVAFLSQIKDGDSNTESNLSTLSRCLVEEYEGYSNSLSQGQEKNRVLAELEPQESIWRRMFREISIKRKTRPGSLVLLRCCESTFNLNETFTGWLDPPLSDEGVKQSQHAGRLLLSEGFDVDVVYTSRLKRSITTAWHALETMDSLFIPVYKTYRLNQRMYGALEGLPREETVSKFGIDVVKAWRQSMKAQPPKLSRDDPSHPIHDRRYSDVPPEMIPDSESLIECHRRAAPLWEHQIKGDIKNGKTVLVVAHKDTLRGLLKTIDNIDDKDISDIKMPRGVPMVYRFDEQMEPVEPSDMSRKLLHTNGQFLQKPGKTLEILGHESGPISIQNNCQMQRRELTLQDSMNSLRYGATSETEERVGLVSGEDSGRAERWSDDPCEFEEYDVFAEEIEGDGEEIVPTILSSNKLLSNQTLEGPFIVLIRHGRTPHNQMELFTGWEDPPLAEEGVEDARNAGRLLKRHGFEFDVVYTSWLTRAIQTAYYTLEELDQLWLPMVKSWRLNERFYGDLTGKSKKMIANKYGEEQLKKWRRGYTIRPPPVSSYSLNYPGNDERRAKHFKDLRFSFRESMARSLEMKRLSFHRKFPKTESLKDCMDRSIPFYTKRIKGEAIRKGKRVLITSHENALRGILMHLCEIPEEAMNQLHLPNGLPLVYDVKRKCLYLLDNGSGKNPAESHDFGPAAKYLFSPCETKKL
ncbi:unnamed protein product [Cylindrotheca closterium]|uniref:phosphoglycerate mutase (2,3-diphosphoglycerate-dependent) n=1 Tax=Cylindrotheca closterium TaxID=2856 RepID=A0AAD2PUD1_9STRA|nr:unnamed protein product [Cylindrotheca closterium]